VHEVSTPSAVDVPEGSSVNDLLAARVRAAGGSTLLERKTTLGGDWVPMTAAAFAREVRAVAKGFVGLGLRPGERVAIMAHTSYEWMVLDFAVWAAGGVPVPVYETSSAEQVAWICSDSGARFAVVETAAHESLVAESRAELPALETCLVLAAGALDALKRAGGAVEDADVEARSRAVAGDDVATIIYTSGTTARPKGVELTHWAFVSITRNTMATSLRPMVEPPAARTLLFMPLAHVFARFVQVLCVTSGAVVGHVPDAKNLVADLGTFQPTFLLAVPRVFEKVYNASEQRAGTGTSLAVFRWAAKVSIAASRAQDGEGRLTPVLRLQHRVAGLLVYRKLRAAMGGALRYAISGGAPLGTRLGHFYRGIGLTVLEGYGLTETSAPTTVNVPGNTKIGTVGPPVPGASLRISDGGEILVRGDHVFRGYHANPEATAEAFDDGWFRTGDIGTLDEDGHLRITGRKKELIVTAGGKNVAPAVLEDRFRGHPLVSQCVVVGDGKPFIGALVTLDAEMLPGWLATHGLPSMDVAAAATHPTVVAALDRAAARANAAVSRAESIRKIAVLTTDFTEANGYLTPSLKVKRNVVHRDFAAEIEGIYAPSADPARPAAP